MNRWLHTEAILVGVVLVVIAVAYVVSRLSN